MRRWLILLILAGLVVGCVLDLRAHGVAAMVGDLFEVLDWNGVTEVIEPR
ncbi:MAG TPA: hypothetical protein VF282_09045 [Bacillota bacterium]